MIYFFFFFNDTATTEIYTLSLHDALPISSRASMRLRKLWRIKALVLTPTTLRGVGIDYPKPETIGPDRLANAAAVQDRSEEHTSELQSQSNLVCRLLLEKKKENIRNISYC